MRLRSLRPPGRYRAEETDRTALQHTEGLDRDVYITHARRTIKKLPVSKLHPCEIGNWSYSQESRSSAVVRAPTWILD